MNKLTSKLIRLRKCARRPTVELYAAGYLLHRVSHDGKPGRAKYQYRLNPDAATHARALLDAHVLGLLEDPAPARRADDHDTG